ncbi:MAG: DUF1552 domain-containing protein [Polyangiaceae bacterium]
MIRFNRATRRAFLGGAGALVALPMLESLRGKKAHAADDTIRRILAYYVPCGIHMAKWTPASTGAGFELTEILQPLANVKDKLMVVSGLANAPAKPDGPGDHASGTGAFLTAAHPFKTEGANIQNGISMDQVAANKIGELTRIPSLQLGLEGGGGTGNCDSGYSCAYARNISWASATQPLPKITSPGVLFDQIFDGFDPEETSAEKAKRNRYRSSILDYVLADAKALQAKLGQTDKEKLDQYLTGVYDVEEKIKKSETGPVCTIIDKPPEDLGFQEHLAIMHELMVLALQCDATRVITFMMANAGSNRSYDFIGVSGGHHEISHHQGAQSNFDKLTLIDIWEMQQFAALLEAMDAVEETDGRTLLENSAVFLSSEIEDGDSHSHFNMPILLAGTGGGLIKSGRHLSFEGQQSVGKLFLSMLQTVGVTDDSFGDAQGALDLS